MNPMHRNIRGPLDLILAIADSRREIKEYGFATLGFAPLMQQRCRLSDSDNAAVASARNLRKLHGLPFWDALMLASMDSSGAIPERALKAATFHQPLGESIEWMATSELSTDVLTEMMHAAALRGGLLAFISSVRLEDGCTRHLPLLDFHVGYSDKSTELVSEVLRLLRMPGALLESGKSYHFYGAQLLKEDELVRFLGEALLFSPIVDRAWIAHQLIERRCALRISPRDEYGGAPRFVRFVMEPDWA